MPLSLPLVAHLLHPSGPAAQAPGSPSHVGPPPEHLERCPRSPEVVPQSPRLSRTPKALGNGAESATDNHATISE